MKIPRKSKYKKRYYKPPSEIPFRERDHKNINFYNSAPWKKFRAAYINQLTSSQYDYLEASNLEDVTDLLQVVPICEKCLKNHVSGGKKGVKRGNTLDHIDPINPDSALDSEGWGAPLDKENVQLLCPRHHNAKSSRDRRIISMRRS